MQVGRIVQVLSETIHNAFPVVEELSEMVSAWSGLAVASAAQYTIIYPLNCQVCNYGVGGVMVSIAAFQAVDLGSIPGQRTFFYIDVSSCFRDMLANHVENFVVPFCDHSY